MIAKVKQYRENVLLKKIQKMNTIELIEQMLKELVTLKYLFQDDSIPDEEDKVCYIYDHTARDISGYKFKTLDCVGQTKWTISYQEYLDVWGNPFITFLHKEVFYTKIMIQTDDWRAYETVLYKYEEVFRSLLLVIRNSIGKVGFVPKNISDKSYIILVEFVESIRKRKKEIERVDVFEEVAIVQIDENRLDFEIQYICKYINPTPLLEQSPFTDFIATPKRKRNRYMLE